MGESRVPTANDTPCCRGVATEASQVSLGHEMGETMGVTNKTPLGDTYILWLSPGLHGAAHKSR